jgi:exonuclease VII small subunit
VTVLLSELSDVEKVRKYYAESINFIRDSQRKQEQVEKKLSNIDEAGKDVPTLM